MVPDSASQPSWNFSGLKALFLNCTLKRSPESSHTERLIDCARAIMAQQGVQVDILRPVDFRIAFGVSPDMTAHGWAHDDWPELQRRVMAADILVIGTPIWLGEKSSVCTQVMERLYANSGEQNGKGQYLYYGRVGGCLVTGNEDGAKHCARDILYGLSHLGFTVPPQADAYWVGEAGPGASYLDEGSGARENDFTNRNVTFMAWNLMHMARLLREQGGIPAWGNMVSAWKDGRHFGHPFYPPDQA